MSRYQRYHLGWPWTPTQVNNLDDMLGDLFKALAALNAATTTAATSTVTTVIQSSTLGPPGLDGEQGEEGIQGKQGIQGIQGIAGASIPGQDGEDADTWPQGTTGHAPLSGLKVYYVSDTSGGAVTRKLTFSNGILISET